MEIFFDVSLYGYLLATLVYAVWFFWRGRKLWIAGTAVLCVALAGQVVYIVARTAVGGRPPLANTFETLVFLAACVTAFFLVAAMVYGWQAMSPLAALAALFVTLFAFLIRPEDVQPLLPALRDNFWLTVHVVFCFVSYAAFLLAYIAALAFLARSERHAFGAAYAVCFSAAGVVAAVVIVYFARTPLWKPGRELDSFAAPEAPGGAGDGLAFDGRHVFFMNLGSTKLLRLDPGTGETVGAYDVAFGEMNYSGLAALAGKVYVLDHDGKHAIAHEYDPEAGKLKRSLTLAVPRGNGLAGIGDPDRLLVLSGATVHEVDPATGGVTGAFDLERAYSGLAVVEGRLLAATAGSPEVDVYVRVDEAEGRAEWRRETRVELASAVGVVAGDGGGRLFATGATGASRAEIIEFDPKHEKPAILLGAAGGAILLAAALWPLLVFAERRLRIRERLPGKIELERMAYKTVALGFPFLSLGIITGSVWANQAWGRYWSWDPKETASLITWLVFAIYLHLRIVPRWRGPWVAWVAVAGFWCVLFTYFGVNYLLAGLHAYG